jgi:23S rRNA (adenine2030-N6)-methyltransferase
MKYRHSYHAGNFADVHKHVALLALLAALGKKDKGFLYLETHAGRGRYRLAAAASEAAAGIGRFRGHEPRAEELRRYAAAIAAFRERVREREAYPGSPLIAAAALRAQDRAVLIELQGSEAQALEAALAAAAPSSGGPRVRVERGDGFERMKAHLPPPERRGLILIDPPYEETREDFTGVIEAATEGLRRFATGVFAAWYPIKEERSTAAWQAAWARAVTAPTLVSELWLYPRDSRVSLNGSGLLIANPPWQVEARMREWLPELQATLAPGAGGGAAVRMLSQS